ncbi:ABA4-like family protein [Eisenibacter elegans]|uniref:ABA4-like family protein n=1 Tax=Eisenibacter elegans TaxID=997 RepID=UPI00040A9D45|nr:ABA4-like family protein [Eisenibacter elegans]
MTAPELVFTCFNTLALLMWLCLIIAPRWKITQYLSEHTTVPTLVGAAYAIIILLHIQVIGNADFSTLEGVKALTAHNSDWLVTAAWFHYLAFDLMVGILILRTAQAKEIGHSWIVPCLLTTFMLGPIGWLLFQLTMLMQGKASLQGDTSMVHS